jgi:hypothetical protein
VTVVAEILMLIFEVAIVHKLWLSTRDFAREMAVPAPTRGAA